MEINISQLEIICHNYWRGECRPSPVNHAYVTNSGSLRVGKLGILTLPGRQGDTTEIQNLMALVLWPNVYS